MAKGNTLVHFRHEVILFSAFATEVITFQNLLGVPNAPKDQAFAMNKVYRFPSSKKDIGDIRLATQTLRKTMLSTNAPSQVGALEVIAAMGDV